MVRVYNSLTKQMEEFKPLREKEVSMYVCGPTVYDRMHIGNSRPVVFDTVARFSIIWAMKSPMFQFHRH